MWAKFGSLCSLHEAFAQPVGRSLNSQPTLYATHPWFRDLSLDRAEVCYSDESLFYVTIME